MKVRKWLAENGEELFTIAVDDWPGKIRVSPDEKFLAVDVNTAVQIHDAENGRLMYALKAADAGYNMDVVISPDGKRLATAHAQKVDGKNVHPLPAAVRIWDLEKRKEIKSLKPWSDRWTNCLAFSPCGKWLAASDGEKAKIWNTDTGEIDNTVIFARAGSIFHLCHSPNGKWLAVGHSVLGVVIHETKGYTQVATLSQARPGGVTFNSKGNLLAGYALGELAVWEVTEKKSDAEPKSPKEK
jgi:WD40 repeat protein